MTLPIQGLAQAMRRTVALAMFAAIAFSLPALADDGTLVLNAETGSYVFDVDVVDTPESRAQGLMFVTELGDNTGMLFDFKEERDVSFWMRNTYIPLDMIFIGANGVIKNIHVNARPHDPTSIPSEGPVQFVLEIAGGRSAELGLKAGDTVEHDRVVTEAAKP